MVGHSTAQHVATTPGTHLAGRSIDCVVRHGAMYIINRGERLAGSTNYTNHYSECCVLVYHMALCCALVGVSLAGWLAGWLADCLAGY
jgi:hypothetical protein